MRDVYNNNYVLACSSAPNKILKQDNGIVSNHAYSILKIAEYNGEMILKLRNPWSYFEFKGKYREDNEQIWADQQLRDLIGYEKKDDGIFCMTLDEFK